MLYQKLFYYPSCCIDIRFPSITHKEEDDEQYDKLRSTASTQNKRNDKIKSHIHTMNALELWKCAIEDTLLKKIFANRSTQKASEYFDCLQLHQIASRMYPIMNYSIWLSFIFHSLRSKKASSNPNKMYKELLLALIIANFHVLSYVFTCSPFSVTHLKWNIFCLSHIKCFAQINKWHR